MLWDYENRIKELEAQLATARELIERVKNNPSVTPWDDDADQFLKETEQR